MKLRMKVWGITNNCHEPEHSIRVMGFDMSSAVVNQLTELEFLFKAGQLELINCPLAGIGRLNFTNTLYIPDFMATDMYREPIQLHQHGSFTQYAYALVADRT